MLAEKHPKPDPCEPASHFPAEAESGPVGATRPLAVPEAALERPRCSLCRLCS